MNQIDTRNVKQDSMFFMMMYRNLYFKSKINMHPENETMNNQKADVNINCHIVHDRWSFESLAHPVRKHIN